MRRCPDIEKMIREKYPEKRVVLVLNKIDLVPKQVAEEVIYEILLLTFFPSLIIINSYFILGTHFNFFFLSFFSSFSFSLSGVFI